MDLELGRVFGREDRSAGDLEGAIGVRFLAGSQPREPVGGKLDNTTSGVVDQHSIVGLEYRLSIDSGDAVVAEHHGVATAGQ